MPKETKTNAPDKNAERLQSDLSELLGRYEALAEEDKCECNEDDDIVYTCKYCQVAGLLSEVGSILKENKDLLA